MNPCPHCGAPMKNPRRKQCGALECKRAFNAERMREYQRRYKEKHGYYQTRLYGKGRKKQYRITCQQCGTEAVVTKKDARYCTRACFYDARYGTGRPRESCAGRAKVTRRARAERALARAAQGARGAMTWVAGRCVRCGNSFIRRNSGVGVQHCSRRCQAKDKADRRRAREAGARVTAASRYRIHERDHWTCHICGDPVDRHAVVPDLAAPVLDHVMPLARGGAHEEGNLATAHFYCNSVKRDLEVGWSAVAS